MINLGVYVAQYLLSPVLGIFWGVIQFATSWYLRTILNGVVTRQMGHNPVYHGFFWDTLKVFLMAVLIF